MDLLEESSLIDLSVQPATVKKYKKQLVMFAKYIKGRGIRINSYEKLDINLYRYINVNYKFLNSRGNRQKMVNLVCAIMFYCPALHVKFSLSQRALRGWDKAVPAAVRKPMTYDIMFLLSVKLGFLGFLEDGIQLLLSFECYLRFSEAARLRVKDVIFPGHTALKPIRGKHPSWGAVYLFDTKTKKYDLVYIRDAVVMKVLRYLCAGKSRHENIFSSSNSKFNKNLRLAINLLQLAMDFTSHCCRHGGATHDFVKGEPFADIKQRGRWASDKSLKRYLNTGAALALTICLPYELQKLVDMYLLHPLVWLNIT